jgi:L-asparaginase / beta-aspartyl-peptidase
VASKLSGSDARISTIEAVLDLLPVLLSRIMAQITSEQSRWSVAVHGGAGGVSHLDPIAISDRISGLHAAILAAESVLLGSNPPSIPDTPLHVAAAVAAVESLESCVHFNAGVGAVLNDACVVENEACVMDGATLRSGAVAGLSTVVFPIRLALLVQRQARFQFLGFNAAEKWADQFGALVARMPNEKFVTERRCREQAHESAARGRPQGDGETVGAVVWCEEPGKSASVACATSTGGVCNKMSGRIGDTPMVGAGSYAANDICAVSGTGMGEEFIRLSAATRVVGQIEYGGRTLEEAMKHVVCERFPADTGGFIGLDGKAGRIAYECNSNYFARGCKTSNDEVSVCALWWP